MIEIYEAIWEEVDMADLTITHHSFLAETRYLAITYCGAPRDAKVTVCKRRVLMH